MKTLFMTALVALATFFSVEQAHAQADPRPNVDAYAVCMFQEVNYQGPPLCIDYADIRMVRNVERVRSMTIPQNTYVTYCEEPNFRTYCQFVPRDLPDMATDFPGVDHGSLIMIPFARAPQMGTSFPSQIAAGNTFPFNPDHSSGGRPDIEVFQSEQGLAFRPINGAKMYFNVVQQPGLTRFHVLSCMTEHLIPGAESRYALVSMVYPGTRICVFTNQGRYALLEVRQENRPNYFAFNWAVSGY